MSDTWSDIQALKSRKTSLRDKMLARKKAREGIVADITSTSSEPTSSADSSKNESPAVAQRMTGSFSSNSAPSIPSSTDIQSSTSASPLEEQLDSKQLSEIEKRLQTYLVDASLNFPVDSSSVRTSAEKIMGRNIPQSTIDDLLQKFSIQQLIKLETITDTKLGKTILSVSSADHSKIEAVIELENTNDEPPAKKRNTDSDSNNESKWKDRHSNSTKADSVENLLSMQSAKEKESKKMLEEIQGLLSQPTAKELSLIETFKSQGGAQVKEFCQFGTREECSRTRGEKDACDKLHFKKIIHKHTDEQLGDCSFLNTCFHMDVCKFVHYAIDYPTFKSPSISDVSTVKKPLSDTKTILNPPQWVQSDLRFFDVSVLGKFTVIMADPPWDIHMELPYGTMSDQEMLSLCVPQLQDDGYLFLWVTGRAMELGRQCFQNWGYEQVDELIWVKTNQLQRIIRTGRTGHWINHGKEHCLIGLKGNPKNVNRSLDCDVIVAEVRATSHKPDEVYGIIERLAPGQRKIELFGRPHNVQPNWVTLGNQLDGVKLTEPDVVRAFKKRYPNGYNLNTKD